MSYACCFHCLVAEDFLCSGTHDEHNVSRWPSQAKAPLAAPWPRSNSAVECVHLANLTLPGGYSCSKASSSSFFVATS